MMTSSNETFSALLVLCVGNSSVSGPRRPDSNLHTKTNKLRYSALPILLGHFSPNNPNNGRDIDVFYEFEVWPKFDFCICVLYCVILYRDISCWYKATNKSNVFLRIPVMSMACCEGRRLSHIVNIG